MDVETHLIVEQHVTQHTNDKQEIKPALENIAALPEELGETENILADTSYFSETNVELCKAGNIEPLIPEKPNSVQAMGHRMQTKEGKALYAKRKSTVETVFGIIKHVQGFRQFLLRGLDSVESEWTRVCIGWNLKRMHALNG